TGGRDSCPELRRRGAPAAKRNQGKGAPYAGARRAQRRAASPHPAERLPPRASARARPLAVQSTGQSRPPGFG
ncbi:hypothetical protein P7K49_039278, partial [Saguinus oedipus]